MASHIGHLAKQLLCDIELTEYPFFPFRAEDLQGLEAASVAEAEDTERSSSGDNGNPVLDYARRQSVPQAKMRPPTRQTGKPGELRLAFRFDCPGLGCMKMQTTLC